MSGHSAARTKSQWPCRIPGKRCFRTSTAIRFYFNCQRQAPLYYNKAIDIGANYYFQNCFCYDWGQSAASILWSLTIDEIGYSKSIHSSCTNESTTCNPPQEIIPPVNMLEDTTLAHVHIWAQGLSLKDFECLPATVNCSIQASGSKALNNI